MTDVNQLLISFESNKTMTLTVKNVRSVVKVVYVNSIKYIKYLTAIIIFCVFHAFLFVCMYYKRCYYKLIANLYYMQH